MTETNIFDLTNVDDIPENVKKDINIDLFAKRIVELFVLADRDLSIDEITVAYYRRYKDDDSEVKTKKQIMSKLYNMSRERNSQIQSVEGKKGIYALCKENNEDMDNL